MAIDKTQSVRLNRTIYDNGNTYYPGNYEPGYLPDEYLIEGLVTQQELPSHERPTYNNAPIEQTIIISSEPELVKEQFFGDKPYTPTTRVAINKATATEIAALPKIGSGTATKIVELRTTEPFKDLGDLKSRVPAKAWDDVRDLLIFE
jgi:DNA uptake protein ComE-like DNA-binding protein